MPVDAFVPLIVECSNHCEGGGTPSCSAGLSRAGWLASARAGKERPQLHGFAGITTRPRELPVWSREDAGQEGDRWHARSSFRWRWLFSFWPRSRRGLRMTTPAVAIFADRNGGGERSARA